jgi:hypothetical protein
MTAQAVDLISMFVKTVNIYGALVPLFHNLRYRDGFHFFDKILLVHGFNYKKLGLVCQGNLGHKM